MSFTPRINFNTLTTPGGIGQGLQGLVGAIDKSSVDRARIAEAEQQRQFQQQGLARLQEQDAANAGFRQQEFGERQRHNKVAEANQQAETGLRGLQSFGQGALNVAKLFQGPSAVDHARADMYTSAAEKNRRQVRDPTTLSAADETRRLVLVADDLGRWDTQAMLNPDYSPGKKPFFGDAPPPAKNKDADRAAYEAERRAYYGIGQGGAPAQNQAPAANLRAQVEARFPQGIPPEWEQSLLEAEANDQDAILQLTEELAKGAQQVAPGPELDLIGNPQ